MDAICSSEILLPWARPLLSKGNFYSHRYKNLKSHAEYFVRDETQDNIYSHLLATSQATGDVAFTALRLTC
jgi:hypothetical protein